MLGMDVGRLATIVVSALAIALVGAVPAMAGEGLSKRFRSIFSDCPTTNPEIHDEGDGIFCFTGITQGGKEGGHFTVGGIQTNLVKKITLHGAATFAEPTNPENPNGQPEGKIWPAKDGRTLEAPPIPVTKGIRLLTSQVQEEAGWPEALKKIYKEKTEKRETQLSATIEIAGGNLIYENRDGLSTGNLIEQQGPAFILPLKVKLSGPFLYRLQKGADTCEVGSDEHPVVQHLTTGESKAPPPFEANTQTGEVGELAFFNEFAVIEIKNNKLVDSTWPVTTEAEGCGGEYESFVNKAISLVLHLPTPAGSNTTELKGSLFSGNFSVVKESQERNGEL